MHNSFEIIAYSDKYRSQILDVWEKSVSATHSFLKPEDFKEIKNFVQTIEFNDLDVYFLKTGNIVAGFIGISERKIEMLFLLPEYIGKGLGKKLTDFAFSIFKVDKVDVNEQNTNAVKFYEKIGFKTYERTEKDDQGKNYPLLRMKLETIEK